MKRNIFIISVALLAILSSCQINVNTKKNDADSEQKNTESVNDNQNATTVESTTPPPTAETKLLYGCVSDPDGYTNIRKSPSTDAPIVRRYESGEFLYFTPFNSNWSKVYSGAKTSTFMGYMATNRIVRVDVDGDNNNASSFRSGYITDPKDTYVNVRKGPGIDYPIIGRLDVGSFVFYQPVSSEWVKIYDNNKRMLGFVAKNRIKD